MRVSIFLWLLSATLLTACGSSADDDDATGAGGNARMRVVNILPPGQSGHVSLQGQLTGQITGNPGDFGPHIDDQREMYWNSQFKPGGFTDVSNMTPAFTPRDGVKIYVDEYGVPVVHGDSAADVWFGAGYAMTVDRLFLLDGVRRTARGTLAELTGPGDVPADIQTRVLTYTEAEYLEIFHSLSAAAQTAVTAYRDGVNARIAEVNGNPTLLPIEYAVLSSQPQPITIADILAAGVLMTRLVASSGGGEMDNVAALRELEAVHGQAAGRRIFRDILWVDDRKAAVTVPDGEFTNIGTPVAQRDAVFEAMADYAATLPLDLQTGPGTGDAPEPSPISVQLPKDFKWPMDPKQIARAVREAPRFPERSSASYQVVIDGSKTANGETLMVNGPQLGYSYPSQLAEIEVHGGGYDARGSTVPGLPVVGIGYTDKTAWALTTGESKTIDSFIETLDGDPQRYIHNGETKQMECRDEVVNYRAVDPVAGAPVGPPVFSVTEEVCRTVHGPVVARSANGVHARSVQYAMWKREVETVEAVLTWNRVRSFAEFHESMKLVTWNENLMYADGAGNIAYYHPGLHPRRHAGGDMRLPLPGNGDFDHLGLLDFEALPKSINPAQGWIANWNNKPALGWGEGVGGDADSLPAGPESRVTNWFELLSTASDLTFEDLVTMDREIGLHDPRARAFQPLFLSISGDAALTAKQQQLLDIVAAWDGDHYNPDIDINDPAALDRPGETIFDVLMKTLVAETFESLLPTEWYASLSRHGNHPHDAKRLENLALKMLNPEVSSIPLHYDFLGGMSRDAYLRDIVAKSLQTLEASYGSATDPGAYRRVHPRSDVCSLTGGITGPCLTMPHQDRGSWIHLVEFAPLPQ